MRRLFIAGNWKMNTTVDEARGIIKAMKKDLESLNAADRVICPPFVSLQALSDEIRGTSIELGAQNMYFREKGAYTGEISALMLKDLCKYVIIGHSERRQIFGETDDLVNQKVKAALDVGLLPILCIGETLEENEGGKTRSVLDKQVWAGLKDIPANGALVVAYEPIWAIGTGRAATASQAGLTIGFVRKTIEAVWGTAIAQTVRILYGGSVTASNIAEFARELEIDGALVGGASLKEAEFTDIVRQSILAKSKT